jgi:hypothetical protein
MKSYWEPKVRWPGKRACLRVATMLHEAFCAVKLRHRQVNGKSKKEKMFEASGIM